MSTEDLTATVARLTAERDRLARILAVERGDVAAAPAGWRVGVDGRWSRKSETWLVVVYEWDNIYTWEVYQGSTMVAHGRKSHALEAMEAAGAARDQP